MLRSDPNMLHWFSLDIRYQLTSNIISDLADLHWKEVKLVKNTHITKHPDQMKRRKVRKGH